MKMKIRNKFIIPVIAILMAILMAGSMVSGTAADTSASETEYNPATHPHTYVPTTLPPTSSLDEEIDAFVSENLGDLADAEDDVREFGGAMGNILKVFKGFIDKIIAVAAKIGEFLSGNWLGIYTPKS